MTPKQAAFREEYKRNIAPWYNGWGHFLSIFVPGVAVVTGRFGAIMEVALVNAGPLTLWLDTRATERIAATP